MSRTRSEKIGFAFERSVLTSWYNRDGGWTRILSPLAHLFVRLSANRRKRLESEVRWQPNLPVIVVGNITVGGVGKTPVVASLVRHLQCAGYKPGVVSRGYGGNYKSAGPVCVTQDSDPFEVGDEPVMLAKECGIPLMVDRDRVAALKALIALDVCDVVIADDGLQHYPMMRDLEWVVVDGGRLFGNGLALPAGPLREPLSRLVEVDQVLVNGTPSSGLEIPHHCFTLEAGSPEPVGKFTGLSPPSSGKVHAVAGIGNPGRFFDTLTGCGFEVIPHPFPDHHRFGPDDLVFADGYPVVMTAKDAVKCAGFANSDCWYLPVSAKLPVAALEKLMHGLRETVAGRLSLPRTMD